jgi:hypothetical protein
MRPLPDGPNIKKVAYNSKSLPRPAAPDGIIIGPAQPNPYNKYLWRTFEPQAARLSRKGSETFICRGLCGKGHALMMRYLELFGVLGVLRKIIIMLRG